MPGPFTIARARATRCRCPPDSRAVCAVLVCASSRTMSQRLAFRQRCYDACGTFFTRIPYSTFSPTCHVREQRVVLEDGVHGRAFGRHLGDVEADELDRPRRALKAPDQPREVVLPEPDEPSNVKNSPAPIESSTWSTATTSP